MPSSKHCHFDTDRQEGHTSLVEEDYIMDDVGKSILHVMQHVKSW